MRRQTQETPHYVMISAPGCREMGEFCPEEQRLLSPTSQVWANSSVCNYGVPIQFWCTWCITSTDGITQISTDARYKLVSSISTQLFENVLMKRQHKENKQRINARQISPPRGEKKRSLENKSKQNAYLKGREQIFNNTKY